MILAGVNSLVTVYYLAIQSIDGLETIFPSFSIWALVVLSVMVPFAIFIGWLHIKRSQAFSSELELQTEVNPYYYKLPPGYSKELLYPTYLTLLKLNIKILNKEALTEEEKKDLVELQKGLENLIQGGSSGLPQRGFVASFEKRKQPAAGDQ